MSNDTRIETDPYILDAGPGPYEAPIEVRLENGRGVDICDTIKAVQRILMKGADDRAQGACAAMLAGAMLKLGLNAEEAYKELL